MCVYIYKSDTKRLLVSTNAHDVPIECCSIVIMIAAQFICPCERIICVLQKSMPSNTAVVCSFFPAHRREASHQGYELFSVASTTHFHFMHEIKVVEADHRALSFLYFKKLTLVFVTQTLHLTAGLVTLQCDLCIPASGGLVSLTEAVSLSRWH